MKIQNLTKYYGDKLIFKDFNLEMQDNTCLGILGISGSGKTTLLNCLAGITDYQGSIQGVTLPVSFVFQTDRLLPNLTVKDNLKFFCPNADIESALKSVGLENDGDLYPKQLSGGMARRVALLRAFLFESNLMLLDEPFRNLDVAYKLKSEEIFKELRKKDNRSCILVTHDVGEAVRLCDRIIILGDGKVVFDGKTDTDKKELEKEITDILLNLVE